MIQTNNFQCEHDEIIFNYVDDIVKINIILSILIDDDIIELLTYVDENIDTQKIIDSFNDAKQFLIDDMHDELKM